LPELKAPTDSELADCVIALSEALLARGWVLVTAESCTGGWIAKCCTDRAGSSAWFERGYVTYSNAAKQACLQVLTSRIDEEGAVSEAVARLMAEGARETSGADVAVAVTGIAGPDGGTAAKPVGTVWFGWALPDRTETALRHFTGDRDTVRRHSVACALRGLLDRLLS
jgi:nicotinamide-nucleotide amidase